MAARAGNRFHFGADRSVAGGLRALDGAEQGSDPDELQAE